MKITPAHDFNDFEVGRRHDLPLINIFDAEAHLDLKDNAAFLKDVLASAELDATMALDGLDRIAARKMIVERLEASGLLEKIEPTIACRAAWRPLRRGARAVPDRPMVCRRQDAGAGRHRGGARAQNGFRAGAMGSDLLQLDGQHPAVVRVAANLVGSSDSGVVRAGRQDLRRRDRGRCGCRRARPLHRDRGNHRRGRPRHRRRSRPPGPVRARLHQARRGCARHLVLFGAVAVLDAWLARRDAGAEALLSDLGARHRLRHHLLLGRADDDDGVCIS